MAKPTARHFSCSLGGQAKGVTIAALLLGTPFLFLFFVILPYQLKHSSGLAFILLVDGMIAFITLTLIGLTPRGYELQDQGVVVRRRFGGSVVYPYSTIASVEIRRPSPLADSVREGANGGLFGYNGYFSVKGLGSFEAHASTDEAAVLLFRKNGDPIVLSPDDLERFLAVCQTRCHAGRA